MYASNAHLIRLATEDDADALRRLAERAGQPSLTGRVLIAQDDGTTVAAISVDDRRTLADPGRFVGYLLPCLQARAQALVTYEAEPSLPARLAAGLPDSYRSRAGLSAGRHRRQVRAVSLGVGASQPSPAGS